MDKPLPENFDPYASTQSPARRKKQSHEHCQEGTDNGCDAGTTDGGPEGPCSDFAPELSQLPHETSMYQRLLDFGLSLLKPPQDASPQEMRRHAIALSVAVALIYAHIAIACGWLSSIGLSGFASASSVSTVRSEMTEVKVTLYAIAIRDLHRSVCNAVTFDDVSQLNGQLQKELAKYRDATGREYQLPECQKR